MIRVLQTGPAQQHPSLRTDGAQPLGKRIDRRRGAVDGVGRHIPYPLRPAQHASQDAQQIGHLIGAGVVGAHQRVGRIERAVQKVGLGVLSCHLQAGGAHPDAGRKHHICMVVGFLLQDLLCIHLRAYILPPDDREPVRESLLQGIDAPLMAADPGTVLGVVLVQEHHPQGARTAEDIQICQQRLPAALLRLQRQLHRLGFGKDLDLLPKLCQVLMDLGRRAIAGICIAVDRQIHQHRIPRGQVQAPAPQHIKLLAELCIKRSRKLRRSSSVQLSSDALHTRVWSFA